MKNNKKGKDSLYFLIPHLYALEKLPKTPKFYVKVLHILKIMYFNVAPRDENGKIHTMSRNIQVSHSKSGKVKSSYFSNLSFVTVGNLIF